MVNIIGHGVKAAKALGKAHQKMIAETDFSLDVHTNDKLFGGPADWIGLSPPRAGLFQNEFRNKDEIKQHAQWKNWVGGDSYYKDTGLNIVSDWPALATLYKARYVMPYVHARARAKATGTLLWEVQFRGCFIFRAGPNGTGPYTMKYMSGIKLAGAGKPVAMSGNALEVGFHHYMSWRR